MWWGSKKKNVQTLRGTPGALLVPEDGLRRGDQEAQKHQWEHQCLSFTFISTSSEQQNRPLQLFYFGAPWAPLPPQNIQKTERENKQYDVAEAIREERRGSFSSLSESINSAFYLRDVLEANPTAPRPPRPPVYCKGWSLDGGWEGQRDPRNSAWHKFEHRYWGERGAPFTLDRDDLRLQVGRVGPEATRSGKHRLPIIFFFLFCLPAPSSPSTAFSPNFWRGSRWLIDRTVTEHCEWFWKFFYSLGRRSKTPEITRRNRQTPWCFSFPPQRSDILDAGLFFFQLLILLVSRKDSEDSRRTNSWKNKRGKKVISGCKSIVDHRNAHQHAAQTRRANVRKEQNLAKSANYIFHATHHHHFACVCVGGGGRGGNGTKSLEFGRKWEDTTADSRDAFRTAGNSPPLFWIIGRHWRVDSVSPDRWETAAPLAWNWLSSVKLPSL